MQLVCLPLFNGHRRPLARRARRPSTSKTEASERELTHRNDTIAPTLPSYTSNAEPNRDRKPSVNVSAEIQQHPLAVLPRGRPPPIFPDRLVVEVAAARDSSQTADTSLVSGPSHSTDVTSGSPYGRPVEDIRREEYSHMDNGIYLDHGGATIYARSTVDAFASRLTSTLLGNPHSENAPAKLSGDIVDRVREETLRFLGADPEHFDLVFVANATAAIKLIADAFRDLAEKSRTRSFWYGYHRDSHTSLVGVRELTVNDHHCFESDEAVDAWLEDPEGSSHAIQRRSPAGLGLFAYPAQSNLSGRRLPLSWPGRVRASPQLKNTYTLLDCAALAMTSPMEAVFGDPDAAPDFACLSFYKIFGFPDLGGLVVRRKSGHILSLRKYFGGGTVTMVSTLGGAWHRSKGAGLHGGAGSARHYDLHDALEDGTLPFHSILALGEAIRVHGWLYGPMANVSAHTSRLARRLYEGLAGLRHRSGRAACRVYVDDAQAVGDPVRHGATIALNVLDDNGEFVPYTKVERLATEHRVYIRSGGVCCPGGLYAALQYEPWELERARSAGHHCGGGSGDGTSVIHQLPTGIVRVSLGAMSTTDDVDGFLAFMREVFVQGSASVEP